MFLSEFTDSHFIYFAFCYTFIIIHLGETNAGFKMEINHVISPQNALEKSFNEKIS